MPQQHTDPWGMHTGVLGLPWVSVDVPRTGGGHPQKDIPRRFPPSLRVSQGAGLSAGQGCLVFIPMVALSPSQVLGCGTTAQSSSSLFFPLMKTLLQEKTMLHDGHIPLGSTEHLAEGDSATQPHTMDRHRTVVGKSNPTSGPTAHKWSNLVSKILKVTLGSAVVMERHREGRKASRDLGQPGGHGTTRVPPDSFSVTTIAWKHLPLSWEQ